MEREQFGIGKFSQRTAFRTFSRRGMVVGGAIAGLSSALGLATLGAKPGQASALSNKESAKENDLKILNNALYYEHQAIWAYQTAAAKLTNTDVGKAVLAVAGSNLKDHQAHRDLLKQTVMSLGGTPVGPETSYDLSSYIQAGEGNLDSDVNIAKLALALETDAAIAYTKEIAMFKTPALITAGASIGSDEAAHATAIRAAFVALGVNIPYVPASFISESTRSQWIIKV